MTKFRDGTFGPTVILFAICFVITLALAFTYQTTKPVIDQSEIDTANAVRAEVMPNGGSFSKITGVDLPDGVTEAYKCDLGFVFLSGAKGFDGIVTYMIGVDNDGNITGINMFDHNETPGLGTKVADSDYLAQYLGDTNPDGVDAVTGATRTTNSLKNSLKQVREAYELVKGAA